MVAMRRLDPWGSVAWISTTKPIGGSVFRRHISLNTAIQRGLQDEDASRRHRSRRAREQDETDGEIQRRPRPDATFKRLVDSGNTEADLGFKPARYSRDGRQSRMANANYPAVKDEPWNRGKNRDFGHQSDRQSSYPRDEAPKSLPFTTATSEFLYGRSTVVAALKARRRKFYKLYLHPRVFEGDAESNEDLHRLADEAQVGQVKLVSNSWLPLMDETSK